MENTITTPFEKAWDEFINSIPKWSRSPVLDQAMEDAFKAGWNKCGKATPQTTVGYRLKDCPMCGNKAEWKHVVGRLMLRCSQCRLGYDPQD